MALIGNPYIVFLDEPSTGIDPASKRFMWNLISKTMANRSVILTSHSMEETEALCSRIGIMVNGALACIGSSQHLRSRFGNGYQIDINIDLKRINKNTSNNNENNSNSEPSNNSVSIQSNNNVNIYSLNDLIKIFNDWLHKLYNGNIELLEQNESHLKYRVDKSLSLGKIFYEIEQNKIELSIKEYSVSETSLEQIFMYFARNQESQDGLNRVNSLPKQLKIDINN